MKKTLLKSLSASLALVLLLPALSLAVFAIGAEEPAHTDVVSNPGDTALPAAALCPGGNHSFTLTAKLVYTDCGSYHLVEEYELYLCANCAYSYTGNFISSYTDIHEYVKTLISTSGETSTYLYQCACGNSFKTVE
ncbi:MAG: hypothetical protein LUJ09_02290 [Firmicutes bacterium]|nr:hypothetical protein [Bacillota bacterium]